MCREGHDSGNDPALVIAQPGSFSWGGSRHQGSSHRRWGGRAEGKRRKGKPLRGSRLVKGVEGVCNESGAGWDCVEATSHFRKGKRKGEIKDNF